eukprot:8232675-Ditylum_brightwellii.AAC.2
MSDEGRKPTNTNNVRDRGWKTINEKVKPKKKHDKKLEIEKWKNKDGKRRVNVFNKDDESRKLWPVEEIIKKRGQMVVDKRAKYVTSATIFFTTPKKKDASFNVRSDFIAMMGVIIQADSMSTLE